MSFISARSGSAPSLTLELLGDGARVVILHTKHIVELAVVAIGPEVVAVPDIDELRNDAQTVAGFPDASLEHGVDAQLLADLADVEAVAFEAKRRRPRGDPDVGHHRQRIDQFLRHASAEIL